MNVNMFEQKSQIYSKKIDFCLDFYILDDFVSKEIDIYRACVIKCQEGHCTPIFGHIEGKPSILNELL